MAGPAKTQGKSIKLHKLVQTAGRDYGTSTTAGKANNPMDLSAKR